MVDAVISRSTSHSSRLHGLSHWKRVGRNGLDLAADTEGADVDVVLLFALFHDSMRLNDGHDPEHGQRGGVLARELRKLLPLDHDQIALLQEPVLVIWTALLASIRRSAPAGTRTGSIYREWESRRTPR